MTAMEQNETTRRAPLRNGAPPAPDGVAEIGALPARWFPADKDKLLYLAIRARVGPGVLEQLGRLRHGAHFDDLSALMRAVRRSPRPAGSPRSPEV